MAALSPRSPTSPDACPRSPRTPAERKNQLKALQKDLNSHLKFLKDAGKALMTLTQVFYTVNNGKGFKINIVDTPPDKKGVSSSVELRRALGGATSVEIKKETMTSLKKQYNRELGAMTKAKVSALTKGVPRPGRGGAFQIPKVFNDELISFFRNAPFPQVNGRSIMDQLSVTTDGISTNNIITTLFTAYVYYIANNGAGLAVTSASNQAKLAAGQKMNRQHMGIDDYMANNLPNILNRVQVEKGFNPNDFMFSSLQQLSSAAVVPEAQWNDDQLSKLTFVGQDAQGNQVRVTDMPEDEKRAYNEIVLPLEADIKCQEKELEKEWKRTFNPTPLTLDYNQLRDQIRARVGRELSQPTLTRLELGRQYRNVLRPYYLSIKFSTRQQRGTR